MKRRTFQEYLKTRLDKDEIAEIKKQALREKIYCVNTMKRTKNYEESLLKALKDPEEALAYLNAAFMDEDQEVFLLALKHVLTASTIDEFLESLNPEERKKLIKNKHLGPDFDDILREEGSLEAAELAAIKMVIADQVAKKTKKKKVFRYEKT